MFFIFIYIIYIHINLYIYIYLFIFCSKCHVYHIYIYYVTCIILYIYVYSESMARDTKVLHEWVAHNRGEFEKTVYRGMEKISCHTGTIDAAWSSMKKFVPNSLSSKSKVLSAVEVCEPTCPAAAEDDINLEDTAPKEEEKKRMQMHRSNLPETHTKRKFLAICAT